MDIERFFRQVFDVSHMNTWSIFESVRNKPELYGLTQAKVKKWKTPGEPAFVSRLLDDLFLPIDFSMALRDRLGPLGMCDGDPLVSGVFMHQKPKVKFRRCHVELADLLFVRHHFVIEEKSVGVPAVIGKSPVDVQARAFLLQAKAGGVPSTGVLSGKELEQFQLYSDWGVCLDFPNKEFGQPADGSPKWNLGQGPMPFSERSGVYGFVFNGKPGIEKSFPDDCVWAVGEASKGSGQVVANQALSKYLDRFMVGSVGRPWDLNPEASDHWSQFILCCLEKALAWKYPLQRLGVGQQTRRRDALYFAREFLNLKSSCVSADLRFLFEDERDFYDYFLHRVGFYPYAYRKFRDGRLRHGIEHLRRSWGRRFGADFLREPNEPDSDSEVVPPNGGISVLYVATFGPNSLNEVGSG